MQKLIRKLWFAVITASLAIFTFGCHTVPDPVQVSADEKAYILYEGIFLDNQQITDIFTQIRGQAPYPQISRDYHVTTAYMPETDTRPLYGQEVKVRIVGYKAGALDDGTIIYDASQVDKILK